MFLQWAFRREEARERVVQERLGELEGQGMVLFMEEQAIEELLAHQDLILPHSMRQSLGEQRMHCQLQRKIIAGTVGRLETTLGMREEPHAPAQPEHPAGSWPWLLHRLSLIPSAGNLASQLTSLTPTNVPENEAAAYLNAIPQPITDGNLGQVLGIYERELFARQRSHAEILKNLRSITNNCIEAGSSFYPTTGLLEGLMTYLDGLVKGGSTPPAGKTADEALVDQLPRLREALWPAGATQQGMQDLIRIMEIRAHLSRRLVPPAA